MPLDPDAVGIGVRIETDVPPAAAPKKRVSKAKKEPTLIEVVSAEEADRQYDQLLADMNHSELVEACRLAGFRVDRGVQQSDLRAILRTGVDPNPERAASAVWKMRDRIQVYLDGHPRIGINPKVCPRNCSLHPDLVVMQCYRSMDTLIATSNSTDMRRNTFKRSGEKTQQHKGEKR